MVDHQAGGELCSGITAWRLRSGPGISDAVPRLGNRVADVHARLFYYSAAAECVGLDLAAEKNALSHGVIFVS